MSDRDLQESALRRFRRLMRGLSLDLLEATRQAVHERALCALHLGICAPDRCEISREVLAGNLAHLIGQSLDGADMGQLAQNGPGAGNHVV